MSMDTAENKEFAKGNDDFKDKNSSMDHSKRSRKSKNCRRNSKNDSKNRNGRQSGTNNPKWYIPNDGMAIGAALAFNQSAGTPIRLNNNRNGGNIYNPGVAAFAVVPTLGYSTTRNSPLALAATKLWTDVRKTKASYSPYDAAALMQYVRAMADVYSYIVYLQRVYGIASTMYSQGNRFMPEALLKANSVSASMNKIDLANFRYGINRMITQASSFNVPATLPIFSRAAFMYQNVYTEGSSIKDQMYMYVPEAFLKLQWNDDPGATDQNVATYLEMVPFRHDSAGNVKTYSYQELLDFGYKLMENLVGDEDINMMGADIANAYGTNLVRLSLLPEYYPIAPIFDIGVLEQMQNADITFLSNTELATHIGEGHFNIVQKSAEFLYAAPPVANFKASNRSAWEEAIYQVAAGNRVLRTTSAAVTTDLVMESTRLKWSLVPVQENGYFSANCGSEILCAVDIYNFNGTDFTVRTLTAGPGFYVSDKGVIADGWRANLSLLAEYTRFDFLPMVMIISNSTDGTIPPYVNYLGDIDNFTVVHRDEIERLHDMALFTMLGIA